MEHNSQDILELQRQIAASIRSGNITNFFDQRTIEACLLNPQEIDNELGWEGLFDLHVLANIFDYRELEYKTVSMFRLKVQSQDIPHRHIGYVYSRTDKGSTLREAILEEMVMKKAPLLEWVTYPNEFLFGLFEEYRKQEDYCTEKWESDESDDEILFVQLKERLSRLHKILRLNSEEEDSEGEGDTNGSDEDGTQSGGEDGNGDTDENEDAQMIDEDEDCGLEEFEKKFLGEISRMTLEVGALQSIF
jgi:hypothetical protein